MTNEVLKKALRFTGKMGVLASEEEDAPVDMYEDDGLPTYGSGALFDETGRYTAVFDPLDGSSNVDAGIPTGTIFGIFESGADECVIVDDSCEDEEQAAASAAGDADDDDECVVETSVSEQCLSATLQPGSSLVCSGYCLYSSSTFFALTLGAGVQIFTLDTQ